MVIQRYFIRPRVYTPLRTPSNLLSFSTPPNEYKKNGEKRKKSIWVLLEYSNCARNKYQQVCRGRIVYFFIHRSNANVEREEISRCMNRTHGGILLHEFARSTGRLVSFQQTEWNYSSLFRRLEYPLQNFESPSLIHDTFLGSFSKPQRPRQPPK